MKKIGISRLVTLLMVVAISIVLASCGDKEEWKIEYNVNGGSAVDGFNVINGETFLEPVAPFKEGYSFLGWYTDSTFNNPYDFSQQVFGDLLLNAKWGVNQYSIAFETNDESLVEVITQDYGTTVVPPSELTRAGYSFDGWYSDIDLTIAYIFTTIPAQNITVYAKWVINQYSISFVSNGGTLINTITQVYGTTVLEPVEPTKGELTFVGWYSNIFLSVPYTFSTMPSHDVTLFAKWAENTLTIFQNRVEIDNVLRDYLEAWGEENNIAVDLKTCGGDTCAYGIQILAEFQADDQPDIFIIDYMVRYLDYDDKILDLTGEAWTLETDLEFTYEGATYGFPTAVEGWGMAYNVDILDAAGVDPLTLTSQAAYLSAFQEIQDYYDTDSAMGDYAVVSMAAGDGMTWVTGLHNFNGYLSAGLAYNDNTIINDLNNGFVDDDRLSQLANWVELLFTWADPEILLYGGYDDQVSKFANGEAAFLHQGNWADASLLNSDFEMAFAPHATLTTGNDAIFVGAPSYYVINKDGDSIDEAKKFLNDLALTTAGHEYMVNDARIVPAFNNVTLTPQGSLSASVLEWTQSGNIYAWWQNDMPAGFGMDVLGDIYLLYAEGVVGINGGIDKEDFIFYIKSEIEYIN